MSKDAKSAAKPGTPEQADEALLTTHEAAALMNHPAAIDALIGYHDACDAGIDAFWDVETDGPRPLYHAHRRKVLYERGRRIMAEDLDIWPDDLRRAFGFPPLPTEGGVRKDSTTAPKGEGS